MTALLRWMLRITAVIGLLFLALLLFMWFLRESESMSSSDLPGPALWPTAAFSAVSLVWILVPVLGLIALRKQWRVPAKAFLVFASILPLASLLIMMTALREELSTLGLNGLVLGVPAWWWVICLLASTTPVLREMGLVPRLWERAIPGVTLAAAGAMFAAVSWCRVECTSPADEALASLRPGMQWREVMQTSAKLCRASRSDVSAGVMWLRCQPTPPFACSPTLVPSIELKFQTGGKLVWWRERMLWLPGR